MRSSSASVYLRQIDNAVYQPPRVWFRTARAAVKARYLTL